MTRSESHEQLFAAWREHLGARRAEPLPQLPGSPNNHYAVFVQPGERPACFVKVVSDVRRFRREGVACRFLAERGFPHLTVRGEGLVSDRLFWRAFDWLSGRSFTPSTPREVAAAGRVLGSLHRASTSVAPEGLRRYASLTDALEQTLAAIAQTAPEAFASLAPVVERARRLYPVVRAFDEAQPVVLLHGDFGWRNLLMRDDGTLVLLDFERAAVGPVWLDLAKCVDRELRVPQDRSWFARGYEQGSGICLPEPPDAYVTCLRLWTAAGILLFVSKQADEAFAEHGRRILQQVKRDLGLD